MSNVDYAEIAKFEALAHRWWDRESEFKPLHDINPLRVNWIDERVKLAGKKVLDVGCGGGILAESMARGGAHVTGIDLSEKALRVAQMHLGISKLEVSYQRAEVEAFAAAHAGEFDAVTCMELLEHVPDPASTVRACAQALRPGGHAFFSTINRNAKSYVLAVIGAEYILRLLPRGTHDYAKFIKPSELAAMCRACGLDIASITGMTYNPLTKAYSLGADCDVNFILHGRRD